MAWGNGDQAALEKLTPLVYSELHRLARRYMGRERPGHTLQTSALVNEAYIRLIDWKNVRWQNRAHFFAVSAQIMRRILVDFARSRDYAKRGGGARQVSLDEAAVVPGGRGADLVALDEALNASGGTRREAESGCRAAVFRRAEPRGDRRGARSIGRHSQARLEPGPRLAPQGIEQGSRERQVKIIYCPRLALRLLVQRLI